MADKVLMKGNEAIAEAAMRAGCTHFFGYPITPQSEIPEYMSKQMPKRGLCFLQAESEVAAINMVYGAAGTGVRVMTSSSSPGVSLKAEGISYLAGADLPALIVSIQRGGPGLGSIQPSQADYFQATKAPGHGDLRLPVYAPASVQEMVDLTIKSFDTAEKYRTPVILLGDGALGQMMEPVVFPEAINFDKKFDWAADGHEGKRKKNVINSLFLESEILEKSVVDRFKKYEVIEKEECMYETFNLEDADLVMVAYGISARIAKSAMAIAREKGLKVGFIRPITLWPFPSEVIKKAAKTAKALLTVELSMGQMLYDVKACVGDEVPVHFYGRSGGIIMDPDELYEEIARLMK